MRLTLAASALLGLLLSQYADADSASIEPPEATIILVNGRVVAGRVAASSDATRLDLVVASDRVQVTTHINWQEVLAILIDGRRISVDAFREHLADHVVPVKPLQPTRTRVPQFPMEPGLANHPAPPTAGLYVPGIVNDRIVNDRTVFERSRRENPRLAHSIDFQVRLANWDQDAEPDGLLLELYILDERGWSLHVPGQFSATLTGLRNESIRGRIAVDGKPPTTQLERWDIRIAASQFQNGQAVVKLPFRRPGRNHEFDVAPAALLQVSYTVASVGVFRATQPDVLINRPSFFRDELYLSTGSQHLPSERRTPQRQKIPRSLRGL